MNKPNNTPPEVLEITPESVKQELSRIRVILETHLTSLKAFRITGNANMAREPERIESTLKSIEQWENVMNVNPQYYMLAKNVIDNILTYYAFFNRKQ